MKVCLLISGLARNVENAFPNILTNLIEPNNPDIFIHTWLDKTNNSEVELEQKIIDLYKPKSIVSEKLKIWKNTSLNMDRMMASYAKPYVRDSFVETFYSCWYSVHQTNLLKEQYRLENNISYSHSIRTRFDINYSMIIDCNKYSENNIYLSNRDLPPEMIDDRFALGPDNLISIYCSSFNYIDYIHSLKDKKDGIFCGESLVYELCKIFKVNTHKIGDLYVSHIR